VVVGTAALLLDGPANAAQIVQRVSDATDGAFSPPQEVVEIAIGVLAGRGFVTVDDGVATLTELGTNVLQWKGVSSETIHAKLGRAAKFGDVIKIRRGLSEFAGLARTIHWSGTDAQKEKLAEGRTKILTAITEAKKSLHSALAES
jgi:phenylpyruvate tautomerase PptA (4-oxalocrotonate tautomerase family)